MMHNEEDVTNKLGENIMAKDEIRKLEAIAIAVVRLTVTQNKQMLYSPRSPST